MALHLKIRGKLLILLTVFAVIPVSIITVQTISAMEKVRESAMESVEIAAQTINDTIDRNLFERYGDVVAFTYNTAAYNPENWGNNTEENPLIVAMNRYMKTYGLYKVMMLVDNDGKLLAVNTRSATGEKMNTEALYNRNYAQEKWFSDAATGKFLEGTNGLTGTSVQPPRAEPLVAEVDKSDGYTIAFSAPAVGADGKTIGVWVNFADFGLVESIIAQQYATLSKTLWENIEIAVLDQTGTVLVDFDSDALGGGTYARNLDVIGKLNLVEKQVPAAISVVQGQHGSTLGIHARKGVEQVSGYSPSAGAYDYPGLKWSTLVRVPSEIAFGQLHSMQNTLLMSLLATLIISTILAIIIGAKAARPVKVLAGLVERLAAGEKTIEVPMTGRYDELGDIARASQIFKENALRLDQMTAEQEQQKKRSEQEKKASQEKIASEFESSVKGIVSIVAAAATELSHTAEAMNQTIVKNSDLAASASDAATQTTANVQTVAAASEELASSVKEISNQLQKTSQLVNLSKEKAENADELANALTVASDKVAGAMDIIAAIAEQINLLALNATIESARAGEAGKGFAVVASEVKNLATQTDRSINEIQSVISEMKQASSAIIAALNEIKTSVGSITEATSSVASAVEEQSATTNEIARNMQIAAMGTQTISANMGDVSASSGQAGIAADQMLQATQELSKQAEGLTQQVDSFLSKMRTA